MELSLSKLKVGQCCTVTDIRAAGSIHRRLLDIGVVAGTPIKCVMKSPCGDPVAYLIRGAVIALRKEDGAKILVKPHFSMCEVNNNGTHHTVGRKSRCRRRY